MGDYMLYNTVCLDALFTITPKTEIKQLAPKSGNETVEKGRERKNLLAHAT
jgi:hypothetical protein